MTLRRRTLFVLVVFAFAIAACSSTGEPSWSLTSSTSDSVVHGPGCDDDPRLVIEADVIELTLDGYLGDRPDPEVGCAMMGIWREFRLTFAEPVAAESVTLEVIEPPA